MVSPLLFSQLLLFALVWLFIIMHLTWPKRTVTAPATPAKPESLTPKRHRSNEPKPFEGLIHKPHCTLCERDTAQPKASPPVRPGPMPSTNRRPREVDTSRHFCPHSDCAYWVGSGVAIYAPMDLPAAVPGVSFTVHRATATFWRPMARSSTANRQRSS